jgi:putative addiction module component (TIGR02574 family)
VLAGEIFQLRLSRGLEFALVDDQGAWAIVIRPITDRSVNYFDVTPPLQTRPHAYIGPRYMDARESVAFPRDVRFVITPEDYDAALEAIASKALWESRTDAEREGEFQLTDEERAELDRRWAEHLENPESGVPRSEVRSKLLS